MDIRKVKKLIELLDESGIAEIEITVEAAHFSPFLGDHLLWAAFSELLFTLLMRHGSLTRRVGIR